MEVQWKRSSGGAVHIYTTNRCVRVLQHFHNAQVSGCRYCHCWQFRGKENHKVRHNQDSMLRRRLQHPVDLDSASRMGCSRLNVEQLSTLTMDGGRWQVLTRICQSSGRSSGGNKARHRFASYYYMFSGCLLVSGTLLFSSFCCNWIRQWLY